MFFFLAFLDVQDLYPHAFAGFVAGELQMSPCRPVSGHHSPGLQMHVGFGMLTARLPCASALPQGRKIA